MVIFASFWKHENCGQTELPDRSILNVSKIGVKCQKLKSQMRHFGDFSNIIYNFARFARKTFF